MRWRNTSREGSQTEVLVVSSNSRLVAEVVAALSGNGTSVRTLTELPNVNPFRTVHIVLLDSTTLQHSSVVDCRSVFPSSRVLVLGGSDESQVNEAFSHGVNGFLCHWEPAATVAAAIAFMAVGGAPVSLPILQILLNAQLDVAHSGIALAATRDLSPRQVEVLQLAARGLSDREIALELTLSVRTVNRHMSDLLKRLGCGNRREATALILLNVPPKLRSLTRTGE